jgi:cytoskeletal protein CcmA (bactofilin family)
MEAKMFDKDQTTISGPGTVVGTNVKLTGTLNDVNDITVNGRVEGEIISEKNVAITETASVKGPITAKIIHISGKVDGAITANEKLEISPTGKVYGSITTKDLIIQSGAIFVGKSNTLRDKSEPELEKKTVKEAEKKEVEKDTKVVETKAEKKDEPKYEVE